MFLRDPLDENHIIYITDTNSQQSWQNYVRQGWTHVNQEDYQKWADAKVAKEYEVLYAGYVDKIKRAEEDGDMKLVAKLKKESERYAPKKAK